MRQSAGEEGEEMEMKWSLRLWTDWAGGVGVFETNICRQWGEIG